MADLGEHETIVIIAGVAAVVILGVFKVIDGITAGTMLGTFVGYTFHSIAAYTTPTTPQTQATPQAGVK